MGVPLPGSNKSIAPATPAAPGATPATGQLSSTDQANLGWTGSFTGIGVSKPFVVYGGFNIIIYSSVNTTLTTTASSSNATVGSGTGIAVGQTIVGTKVPPGTIVASVSGTDITLAFPPGYTNADVTTGADATALFYGPSTGATGTIVVERSVDGGIIWNAANIGGAGAPASYAFGSGALTDSVCAPAGEQEKGVAYRLNCRAYSSGTFSYRISATGTLATTLGIPGP